MSTVPPRSLATFEFSGRLVRNPLAGEWTASESPLMRPATEREYRMLSDLAEDRCLPVHVCRSQYYRLLEDLVVGALTKLGGLGLIAVRFKAPGLVRLPETMLAPPVFLVHEPQALIEGAEWDVEREGVLSIDDSIRLDNSEFADDTLTVRGWGRWSTHQITSYLRARHIGGALIDRRLRVRSENADELA